MSTELPPMYDRLLEVAAAAREVVAVCCAADVELPVFVAMPLAGLSDTLKALDAHRDAVHTRLSGLRDA